ncbi:MAG: nucleotide exchange factor GrpE [Gammaproteobacteria bacterium]
MNDNNKSVDTEDEPVSAEAQSDSADESAESGSADNSGEVTIDSLQAALAAMEEKADDHWARYLRTAAEVENVRKRGQRDVEKAHKFGFEKFAGDLLGVRDSLVMGLDAAKDKATVESLVEGSEMTLKLLEQVLTRHGVTEINPVGEAFNPELHEALVMVDSPDAEPNTVVQVVQTGFEINGRLLRAARVMVAKD